MIERIMYYGFQAIAFVGGLAIILYLGWIGWCDIRARYKRYKAMW